MTFAEGVKKALDLVEEVVDRRNEKPLGDRKHSTGRLQTAGLGVHQGLFGRIAEKIRKLQGRDT